MPPNSLNAKLYDSNVFLLVLVDRSLVFGRTEGIKLSSPALSAELKTSLACGRKLQGIKEAASG